MNPIEVTAFFDLNGSPRPISFSWNGRTYRVDSIGRAWRAEDGFHVLVMTPGNRAYHLLLALPELRWYIARSGDISTVIPV